MHRLVAMDPRNAERIFPYLGGEEVNTDPRHAHRRWCIDFNDFPLRREVKMKSWAAMTDRERAVCRRTGLVPGDYAEPVAADWPDLLEIVERLVKPERDVQKRDAVRERWWQFAEKRPGLRAASKNRKQILVVTQTSPHLSVSMLNAGSIYDQKLIVISGLKPAQFPVCQARLHEVWARAFTATMKDDLSYTPTDAFQPFPFPTDLEFSTIDDEVPEYLTFRSRIMVGRGEGLTQTYNRFHDPDEQSSDILHLRELHHAMDEAVLRAYGWDDLAEAAAPEFLTADTEPEHRYQGRLFWPAPFRDEVLARLLALNAERADDERRRGLAPGRLDTDDDGDAA
jgi:hypothetical protein